ncbi:MULTISPECIES: DUF3108 domain-containing protein [Marinobacter]|jgi:hypothetical protein|nr:MULTISPECIES: DUF3108 domain-containing protein [unclassified Marinobacter]MAP31387.1 hypothetical protein [Marinobacter sp.]MEC7432355.1 DUF3108 domain-containing protein [Pseudomonadota bacterium]HAX10223.1 DUF3108 domain-containing protein [Marinobacter nauticus]MEC9040411.1 DUF3108 domain-containing protein [Pseudomonadota bacterium]MEC9387184.1 DUF3108 domain-containing protein [Pseudomonadota bacterium]|tara:strand:- start:2651 stop:3391 length:741 start_codon:yes stop_codon:yes gene_type:complete
MHTDTPHKPRFQLWAALIAGMIALPASAGDVDYAPLAPYEARYTASMSKGVSLNGEGVRELTDQGNNVWLYRTDVDSFIADINESLIFRWENGQVIPLRYRYHLSGFLIKDRKQSIDFDWQAGTATGSYRGEKFEVELRDKTLDPLGYQLQLHQDLKAGKRDVTYQVLDKGDYDDDRFAVIDEDSLGDNGRTMNTLKAEKVRDEDSKRQTLMWFDPARDYLLVRLLQVEPDGSEYELKLKDATLAD